MAQKTVDNAKVRLQSRRRQQGGSHPRGTGAHPGQTASARIAGQPCVGLSDAGDDAEASAGQLQVTPPPEPSTELGAETDLVDQALRAGPSFSALICRCRRHRRRSHRRGCVIPRTCRCLATSFYKTRRVFLVESPALPSEPSSIGRFSTALSAMRSATSSMPKSVMPSCRIEQLRDSISDEVINARRTVVTKRQGLVTAQRALQMAQRRWNLCGSSTRRERRRSSTFDVAGSDGHGGGGTLRRRARSVAGGDSSCGARFAPLGG